MNEKPMPELLAPAGDFERLQIALAYGADAVYAGQPQFSLRGRENGFKTTQDLAEGIRYCHDHGKIFYLASNLVPHNNKILPFQKALTDAIEQGPDALIMTDPGMIHWVRTQFPHMPVHLSVQANTVNWISAQYWHNLGISRVILTRELRLREVAEIIERCAPLEIEVFVHGAVCMASSGRCMLSNYLSHRDANQGNCNNACRFPWTVQPSSLELHPLPKSNPLSVTMQEGSAINPAMIQVQEDEHGTYFMNSRDLCALPVLEDLVRIGVRSVKIEGRTKSPYYLAKVVHGYRIALDAIAEQKEIPPQAMLSILDTEHRGLMSGFYTSQDPIPQNLESARHGNPGAEVVAQIRSFDPTTQVAKISVRNKIHVGETLELFSPQGNWTFTAQDLRKPRGESTDILHPGLEGCQITLPGDCGPAAFLVRRLQSAQN